MKEENKLNKIIGSINSQLEIRDTSNQNKTISRDEMVEIIASRVKFLIENEFEKFLTLMYRLDISEKRLKILMTEFNGRELYHQISKSIIEREEEKIETRKKYSS